MHRASDMARRGLLHMDDSVLPLRRAPMQEGAECLILQFQAKTKAPVD